MKTNIIYNAFKSKKHILKRRQQMSLSRFALIFPLRIIVIFVTCLFYSLGRFRWCPLSMSWLRKLDKKGRSFLKHKHSSEYVTVRVNGKNVKIWTVSVQGDKGGSTTPIVLLHGVTGGCNLFLNNIDELAKHRHVYLIDLPGWGLSGAASIRVKFEDRWWTDTTAKDVDQFYVESLDKWLQKMKMDKAILFGHGFGAYVCMIYSLYYPKRVAHLIVSEVWGYHRRPASADDRPFMKNIFLNVISDIYAKLLVFTPIRALGPFALPLYRLFRLGMKEKFMAYWNGLDPQTTSVDRIKQLMMEERTECFPDMTMQDYTYLWMMHSKNGEIAYDRLSIPFGWARLPFEERIEFLSNDVDITVLFGSRSWSTNEAAVKIKHTRHASYAELYDIAGAGHHLFADRPSAFNHLVNLIGKAVDKGVKPNIVTSSEERSNEMLKLRRQRSSSLMLQVEARSCRSKAEELDGLGEVEDEIMRMMDEQEEEGSELDDEDLLGAVGGVAENDREVSNENRGKVFFTLE